MKHPISRQQQYSPRQVTITADDIEARKRREAYQRGEVYVSSQESQEQGTAVSARGKEGFTCMDINHSQPSESLCRSMSFIEGFPFTGVCTRECKGWRAKQDWVDRVFRFER